MQVHAPGNGEQKLTVHISQSSRAKENRHWRKKRHCEKSISFTFSS